MVSVASAEFDPNNTHLFTVYVITTIEEKTVVACGGSIISEWACASSIRSTTIYLEMKWMK
jgi:hypothetical protein